jgi:hypothetical protein
MGTLHECTAGGKVQQALLCFAPAALVTCHVSVQQQQMWVQAGTMARALAHYWQQLAKRHLLAAAALPE